MEHSRASEDTFARGIRLHTVPIYRGLPVTQDPKLGVDRFSLELKILAGEGERS